jgi:integrase
MKRLDVELSSNPCIGVEWFKERNHRPSIAAADLPTFWRAVNRVENPIPAGFWRICALSGLRKNDVSTMRWEHAGEDRIHIPHPKMKKPFNVPLTDALRNVLSDLREHGAVVFPRSPYVCAASSQLGYLQNPMTRRWQVSVRTCAAGLRRGGGARVEEPISREGAFGARDFGRDGNVRGGGFRAESGRGCRSSGVVDDEAGEFVNDAG